jgi:hypothetical protein
MGVQVPPRARDSYKGVAPRRQQNSPVRLRFSAGAFLRPSHHVDTSRGRDTAFVRVGSGAGWCSSVSEHGGGGGLGGGGVVAFEGVGVDLHGHGGVGVADALRDDLDGHACAQGEGGSGVSEAVDDAGQAGGVDVAGEQLRGAFGWNGGAVGTGEHQVLVLGVG